LRHLVGKVIIEAVEEVESDTDVRIVDEYHESCTTTRHILKTDDETVVCKWFGSSNGYYSESVDIKCIGFSTEELLAMGMKTPVFEDDRKVLADYWHEHGEYAKEAIVRNSSSYLY